MEFCLGNLPEDYYVIYEMIEFGVLINLLISTELLRHCVFKSEHIIESDTFLP